MEPNRTPDNDAPTVLVVEDEALIRLAVSDQLAESRCKVYEAGDAGEAIDILTRNAAVDLVFSDIRMPGVMDGFDLAAWIHAHRPRVAIVLTSGDTRGDELATRLAGGELFFAKPYDLLKVAADLHALAQTRHDVAQ